MAAFVCALKYNEQIDSQYLMALEAYGTAHLDQMIDVHMIDFLNRHPSWMLSVPYIYCLIYEFAAQFTNASYMVANRYSFNPKHREMAFPYGICKAAPFAKLLHW